MRKPLNEEENARRLVAYQQTANDADASKALGLKGETFRLWRRANGLPAKAQGKPRGPHGGRAIHKVKPTDVAAVADMLKAQKCLG